MSDVRYRAQFIDPGNVNPERPIQTFANSPESVDDWAQAYLSRAVSEDARVDVFTVAEVLTRQIKRVKQVPRDQHGRCITCQGKGWSPGAAGGITYCECPTGEDLKRLEARGK